MKFSTVYGASFWYNSTSMVPLFVLIVATGFSSDAPWTGTRENIRTAKMMKQNALLINSISPPIHTSDKKVAVL